MTLLPDVEPNEMVVEEYRNGKITVLAEKAGGVTLEANTGAGSLEGARIMARRWSFDNPLGKYAAGLSIDTPHFRNTGEIKPAYPTVYVEVLERFLAYEREGLVRRVRFSEQGIK